ncbi:aldolase/citrate lyase family protein, partial [Nocardioides aquaticus]|uniref:aldolase/citrate lyase family protein n=1 Tax=Nocardioides aquaticus TaxID=160826 RepID=UPI0031DEC914
WRTTIRPPAAATAIARASSVDRLVLGTYDLAAQLGVSPDDRLAMAGARQALVLASAAAGLAPPVDGVTGAVGDEAVLVDDLEHAVRLGLGGKLCLHPRQVPVAAAAFRPTADEVAWAERVVAAAAGSAGGSAGGPAGGPAGGSVGGSSGGSAGGTGASGVVLLDGQMVDKPVVDRARRVLARRDDASGQPR